MSEVINPPDYYFTGINFNPAFYADDTGGGLSETTANTLYLRKTIPDTATAIETFNLGIKTTKVDGLVPATTLYVGNNITTGSVILGNLACRTKSAGIFETASIRAPATNGTVSICADATAGGGVDIGSANGTVNLLASSSGGVNVPTSGGASSNAVNVGYLTTALANTATLNQIQTFTQTNTFNNATAGIKADIIQGIATTGTQSLFTTKTSGELTCLAVGTGVLNVKGSGIKFDTLTTDNPTGTQGLYTNKTAGTLSIATTQTLGNINIGGVGSTTTIKGNFTVDETITMNKPITFGWTSIPTTNTQLGFKTAVAQITNAAPTVDAFTVGTVSITPAGCFLVVMNIQMRVPSTVAINAQIGVPDLTSVGFSVVYGDFYQGSTSSFIVNTTGSYSQAITMIINAGQRSSVSNTYFNYNYTRIG